MQKRLYLLDGMALVYRAHFAFIRNPILTSQGVNTSALYGFTNTLLDLLANREPTHIGVAFDTSAPTPRHEEYPEYKAQREEMPEDLSAALPHVRRMVEAFNIPVLIKDGFEADDIIGTLVRRAEKEDFESYMVTPDKDFSQLVSEHTFLYRPGRQGNDAEVLGVPEILTNWGIERIDQVIDILGLQGDAVDNIPGIPGIGPKTAQKLIAQFGSIEELLKNTDKLKGKQKENVEKFSEQALLSKRLATIILDVPIDVAWGDLEIGERNDEAIKEICVEFEFNSLGKRLFGGDFKAGRGQAAKPTKSSSSNAPTEDEETIGADLKTAKDVEHDYQLITKAEDRAQLIKTLSGLKSFCFDTETTSLQPRNAQLLGFAFSWEAHKGCYVAMPNEANEAVAVLEEFRPLLENPDIEKVGHNLKYDLAVLQWNGINVRGKLFDTMLAHALVYPDARHSMDYLSEVYLGYTPISISSLIGDKKGEQLSMALAPLEEVAEYASEDADVTWQLRSKLEPLLEKRSQTSVYWDIEEPLIPVLVDMEHEGIRIDSAALAEFSVELEGQMKKYEAEIYELAGTEFNLNSPRQLGEILFDRLKLADKPKKTRTGQFSTNEQTLLTLAHKHEVVQRILDYRGATKLKSTYSDTLPTYIWPKTNRVHTTYNQAVTATGRLNSQDPNLQNIPIRTEMGREIRKAFVPRDDEHVLLSADYSQIELRIIAAISQDKAMQEAFASGHDIHAATAAKVYNVEIGNVLPEMRSTAKMVNYGLAYGMSAFGLSQRLGIPRKEAAAIMKEYFKQFPGIQKYMTETVESARENGYVQTHSGRRRYLRDINSANATVRNQAERNAINAPIQGTAADMIKIAMVNIQHELTKRQLRTKMLLQVHDELVFDVYKPEEEEVRALVADKMQTALKLDVPIVVEMGSGQTWLEAH